MDKAKAASRKPEPAGIGGVLRNIVGEILFSFSRTLGLEESNQATKFFKKRFMGNLIIKGDSKNTLSWDMKKWKSTKEIGIVCKRVVGII